MAKNPQGHEHVGYEPPKLVVLGTVAKVTRTSPHGVSQAVVLPHHLST
jgi:hypothetical protein